MLLYGYWSLQAELLSVVELSCNDLPINYEYDVLEGSLSTNKQMQHCALGECCTLSVALLDTICIKNSDLIRSEADAGTAFSADMCALPQTL